MAKYLALILIIAIASLFYPFRDLYVREDPFSDGYALVSKGFWTLEQCESAADAQAAEDYYCRKRTMFGSFLGTSAEYNRPSAESSG